MTRAVLQVTALRVLLVQSRSPVTYWSYQYSLPFAGKAAALPPLGLVTLAALLPPRWELRLVDLEVEPLADQAIRWADVVMVSGMLVHADSMREVLSRARALGKRTVAGGAGPTPDPDVYPEADHVLRGEAERRLALLVEALEHPDRPAPRDLSPDDGGRPGLEASPVPRFELLDLSRYASLSIQLSRGCPFRCEFCDIIEVFGRIPRLKSAEQVRFVSLVVIVETAWALRRLYLYDRWQIATALGSLLNVSELEIESAADVRSAVAVFATSAAGLVDCLVARTNVAAGCEYTINFDRKAAKLPGFELLKA